MIQSKEKYIHAGGWNDRRESVRRAGDYAYARSRIRRGKQGREFAGGYAVATHFAQVIAQERRCEEQTLEQRFEDYAERWRNETRIHSSIQASIFNQNYQRIIGMGPQVLPLILEELKERGGPWYWALECITGVNPAEGATTLTEQKRLWIEYAILNQFFSR